MIRLARTKSFNEQEVLEKILMLFWQKGFHQSSLGDILKAAGISKQSVYDTYGDKKTLFIKALTLYREHTRGIESLVQQRIVEGISSIEILRRLLYQGESTNENIKGCLMINSMVELRDDDAAIRAEIDSVQSFFQELMEKLVTLGQQSGDITTILPASHIVAVLMNARNGFQVGIDYSMSAKSLHETADYLIELIRAR